MVRASLGPIRTQFGRFARQNSGYPLEHLLPERGGDLARALVGSEGTLAVVLGATVRLVRAPAAAVLVVLGYPDMATAADAVGGPAAAPVAIEGIDARIVEVVRRRGRAVPELPEGGGWLLVELAGATAAEAEAAAGRLVAAAGGDALASRVLTDPAEAAAIWRIREDGAGFGGRSPAGAPAWAGWEDAAVPPERLGAYLRDFEALLADHGLGGIPYGHFGDGCLHVRIDFPFDRPDGRAVYRSFVEQAAELVGSYGGSMSGSTATGAPAPSCSRGCSSRPRSRPWPPSRPSSTRATCSTRGCWCARGRSTPTCAGPWPARSPGGSGSATPRTAAT